MRSRGRLADSPSVLMSAVLIIVYLLTSVLGEDFFQLNVGAVYPFVQDNAAVKHGAVWMLITSMFLHGSPLHLFGNVFFLLLLGTSLEEQVSRSRWLVTYFASGLVGSLFFLALGGDAIGVGASGAIWGLLGAAGGVSGLVGMMFYGGLNIFSGGGFLAHAGGLIAGLMMRYLWPKKLRIRTM